MAGLFGNTLSAVSIRGQAEQAGNPRMHMYIPKGISGLFGPGSPNPIRGNFPPSNTGIRESMGPGSLPPKSRTDQLLWGGVREQMGPGSLPPKSRNDQLLWGSIKDQAVGEVTQGKLVNASIRSVPPPSVIRIKTGFSSKAGL
jgi:hypothetical protein